MPPTFNDAVDGDEKDTMLLPSREIAFGLFGKLPVWLHFPHECLSFN